MEESISKFLALEESSSDSQDALRKITLALQGLQLNEEESAVSYIDFIKFKFQRKTQATPKVAAAVTDAVEAEWLHDFLASNAAGPVTQPLPATEPDNGSDDQAEALPLSPSTFAWRFDDKYLAGRRVKVDNFVSAPGDEDDAPRPPPTESSERKPPAFSSYLPSGMTLDDDASDDEPDPAAACDGTLEDLEDEDEDEEERNETDSAGSRRNELAPFRHVVVDGASDDCDAIEDLDGDTHSETDDDEAADDGGGRDDDFMTAMIAFLQSSGSRNASLAQALREQQLAARYGLQLDNGVTEDASPCDDEVHEFSFE